MGARQAARVARKNAVGSAADDVAEQLPGIKVNTSPDNFSPIRQFQLAAFDGESWQLFGDIISD